MNIHENLLKIPHPRGIQESVSAAVPSRYAPKPLFQPEKLSHPQGLLCLSSICSVDLAHVSWECLLLVSSILLLSGRLSHFSKVFVEETISLITSEVTIMKQTACKRKVKRPLTMLYVWA